MERPNSEDASTISVRLSLRLRSSCQCMSSSERTLSRVNGATARDNGISVCYCISVVDYFHCRLNIKKVVDGDGWVYRNSSSFRLVADAWLLQRSDLKFFCASSSERCGFSRSHSAFIKISFLCWETFMKVLRDQMVPSS
jgi:hypothetical protein